MVKLLNFSWLTIIVTCLLACAQHPNDATRIKTATHPIPQSAGSGSIKQIFKTELDRMTDIELRQNIASLRLLMLKLYKRNPKELLKSQFSSRENAIHYLFEASQEHHYDFASLNHETSVDAIFLAFNPQYEGDRVFAFISGLQTMLLKAHGSVEDFYITNDLDPQKIYNVARNFEIAAWKLANAKDEQGNLYLISNTMNAHTNNISMEREFGKMIGRTDLFAITLSEKTQRTISRVVQNIATALFLPI